MLFGGGGCGSAAECTGVGVGAGGRCPKACRIADDCPITRGVFTERCIGERSEVFYKNIVSRSSQHKY